MPRLLFGLLEYEIFRVLNVNRLVLMQALVGHLQKECLNVESRFRAHFVHVAGRD